jgi:hypothetical protein
MAKWTLTLYTLLIAGAVWLGSGLSARSGLPGATAVPTSSWATTAAATCRSFSAGAPPARHNVDLSTAHAKAQRR